MIQREENTTYIATISGGKDSVTMCDLLLKNGYPVDEIIFCDTLLELDLMYSYIEKVKLYFKTRYNREIITLKPKTTFEHWCYGIIEKPTAKRKGQVRGIPTKDSMCYWRRESKIYPVESFIRKLRIYNEIEKDLTLSRNQKIYKDFKVVQYIGYTKGENRSVQDTEYTTFLYPLVDIFRMTEEDCKSYLINQDMENPIYRFLSRSGCGCCPYQSDKAWFEIWKNDKKVWNFMMQVERNLIELEKQGYKIINKYWFMGHKNCVDMEKIFIEADKQGSLFDFSDEPLKDCFCKI